MSPPTGSADVDRTARWGLLFVLAAAGLTAFGGLGVRDLATTELEEFKGLGPLAIFLEAISPTATGWGAHMPLPHMARWCVVAVLGEANAVAWRLPAALMACVAAGVTFQVFASRGRVAHGVVVGLLLALHPTVVFHAHSATGYAFGGASGALLFAGTVGFREGRASAPALLASGFILGLGSTLFFVFPAVVAAILCALSVARAADRPARKKLAWRAAVPTVAVLGLPSAWMLYRVSRLTLLQVIEPHADEIHQGTAPSVALVLDLLRRYSASWFAGYAEALGDDPWVWAPGAVLLAAGIGVGLAAHRRDTPSSTAALLLGGTLSFIALAHLGFVAGTGREFTTQPRIFTPLAAPLAVCWAAAVHPLTGRWRVLTAGLLLLLLGTMTLRVHHTWSDRDRWAADLLERLADDGDTLLVTPQVAHRLSDPRRVQVPSGECLRARALPPRIWWTLRGDHDGPPGLPMCDGSELSWAAAGYRLRFQQSRQPPLFERMSDSFIPTLMVFLLERGPAARGPASRPTVTLTAGLLAGASGGRLEGFVRSIADGEAGGEGSSFERPFAERVTLPVQPRPGRVLDLALHPERMDGSRVIAWGGLRGPHAEALIGWRPLVFADDPIEGGWELTVPAFRSPALRVAERVGRALLIVLLFACGGLGWMIRRIRSPTPPAAVLLLPLLLLLLAGCSCGSDPDGSGDGGGGESDGGIDPFANPAIHGGNGLAWIAKLGPSPRDFPGTVGVVGSPSALDAAGLGGAGRAIVSVDPTPEGRCARAVALESRGARLASRFTLPADIVGGACSPADRGDREDAQAEVLHPLEVTLRDGARLVFVDEAATGAPISSACRLRGLQEVLATVRAMWELQHRDVAFATAPPGVVDGPSAWLIAEPAELISLAPLAGRPTRLALTGQALRSQGRRGLLPTAGVGAESLALHLITGGALQLDDGAPLGPDGQALLDYARAHPATMFLPRPRVALYVPMASIEEGVFADGSSVPLEEIATELTALGVPFDVVVGPDERRLFSAGTGEYFDRFQVVVVLGPEGLNPSQAAELARFRHGGLVLVLGSPAPIEAATESPGAEAFAWREGRPDRAGVIGLEIGPTLGEVGRKALAPFAMLPEAADDPAAPTDRGALRLFRYEAPHEGLVALHIVRLGSLDGPVRLSVPHADLPVIGYGPLERQAPGLPSAPVERSKHGRKRRELELPPGHRWMTLVARTDTTLLDPLLVHYRGMVGEVTDSSVTLQLPGWPASELPAVSLPEQWTVQRAASPAFEDLEGPWEVDADRTRARRTASNGQVETVVSIQIDGGEARIEMTVRNLGAETLEDVRAKICLDPAGEAGFPSSGHDRTWIVDAAGRHRLSDNRHRFGDPLYVEEESFLEPVTVAESIGGRRSFALAFERSGGVGGNALGGGVCIHAQPIFGDIAPGGTARVRGWLALVDGSASAAFELYDRSSGLTGTGRGAQGEASGRDHGAPWTTGLLCPEASDGP